MKKKKVISTKVKCYCGFLLSKAGIKAHISNSLIHRKRMRIFNIDSDYYVNAHNPFSRVDKKIEITKDKYILDFT